MAVVRRGPARFQRAAGCRSPEFAAGLQWRRNDRLADLTTTTPATSPHPARYPPHHQLPTANSNTGPRIRALKRNTLVGPQLHQGGAKPFQVSSPARAIWLLLPILLGAVAATQTLAQLLNYHPSLGPNLFHLYPPWSYFVWSYLWRQTNPAFFSQAFGVGVIAAIVSFLFFVLALSRS